MGVTYLPDEKGRFGGKVRDLTAPLAPSLFEPLNVQDPAQIEAVFAKVAEQWGSIDVLVHCLASLESRKVFWQGWQICPAFAAPSP